MNWLVAHATIAFVAVLIVVSAIILLQQRRAPQSTLAWLLFVVAIPYIAVPAFLMFGSSKQSSRFKVINFTAAMKDRTAVGCATTLEGLLCRYGLPEASDGNRFDLLLTGEAAYRDLFKLIADASESIDVTFYAVGNDPVGRCFVEALEQKAREGVAVRLILDEFGALKRPRAELRRLAAAGGQIRLFAPFLHSLFSRHINLRNHRKMLISDRKRVFTGGMNVAEQYLGPVPLEGRWRDLACILEGPVVDGFNDVFESDWAATENAEARPVQPLPEGKTPGEARLQLAASGPDIRDDAIHDAVVQSCFTATRRIWIVTPYFLPTVALFDALAIAGRRGIDVRVCVPEDSNQRLADFARGVYMRDLEDAGCRMFLFPDRMVHAKAAVIDDVAFVGSANMDIRSLLINFEASLVVYSPVEVAQVSDWMEALCTDAVEGMPPAGRWREILEGFFKLGAPMM